MANKFKNQEYYEIFDLINKREFVLRVIKESGLNNRKIFEPFFNLFLIEFRKYLIDRKIHIKNFCYIYLSGGKIEFEIDEAFNQALIEKVKRK